MFKLLFVVALGSVDAPDHGGDAALYLQSLITPKVFAFCKTAHKDAAESYDAVLAAWQQRHEHAIARGEFASREKAINGTGDFDADVHAKAKEMIAEIGALPPEQQKRHCESLRERTRVAGES